MWKILIAVFSTTVIFSCGAPAALADDPASLHAEAREIVKRMHGMYRGLATYQHTAEKTSLRYDVESHAEDRLPIDPMVERLWFEAPNKLAIETDDFCAYTDGETLWVYSKERHRYIERKAPKSPVMLAAEIADASRYNLRPTPVIGLLTATMPSLSLVASLVKRVHAIDSIVDATVIVSEVNGYGQATSDSFVVISAATGLLEEIRLDRLRASEQSWSEWKPDEVFTGAVRKDLTTISNVRLDEPIDASVFVFRPGPLDVKIEKFKQSQYDRLDALEMIGQKAPSFVGRDVRTNKNVVFDAMRGQVVALWFVNTRYLQDKTVTAMNDLAQRFDGQRVRFVLVSSEDAGRLPAVERLAGLLHGSFWIVHNEKKWIIKAYLGTPAGGLILIDHAGIVRDIESTWIRDDDQSFTDRIGAQIARVLAGEPVVPENEFAERLRKARDERSGNEDDYYRRPVDLTIVVDEHRPALLRPMELIELKGFVLNQPRVDLDGDGLGEILAPQHDGSIAILDASGDSRDSIRLDFGFRSRWVRHLQGIKIDGREYIAAGTSSSSGINGGPSVSVVGVFDSRGDALWVEQFENDGQNSSVAAIATGDLDEDGVDELIVAVSVSSFSSDSRREGSAAYVEIRSGKDGAVLSRRAMDSMVHQVEVLTREMTGKAPVLAVWTFDGLERFEFGM